MKTQIFAAVLMGCDPPNRKGGEGEPDEDGEQDRRENAAARAVSGEERVDHRHRLATGHNPFGRHIRMATIRPMFETSANLGAR